MNDFQNDPFLIDTSDEVIIPLTKEEKINRYKGMLEDCLIIWHKCEVEEAIELGVITKEQGDELCAIPYPW